MIEASSIIFVLLTFFLVLPNPAHAASCEPLYGGGPNCINTSLTISKTILNPQTNAFVSDLGINDPRYHPGDIVTFQIKVSTAGQTIPRATITDYFPQNFIFTSGAGTFDPSTNTLTAIGSNINQSNQYLLTILGRIPEVDKILPNQQTVCQTNLASVIADNNQPAQATTEFCIDKQTATGKSVSTTKGGLPVYNPTTVRTNPPTGSETVLLPLFILSAVVGIIINRHKVSNLL